jgi:sensor histidine kinase YesM
VRNVLQIFLVNCGIAVVPALALLWFSDKPSLARAWEVFYWSALYANVIGFSANYVFPRVTPVFSRLPGCARWPAIILTLAILALAGSSATTGLLLLIGAFPQGAFSTIFWQSLRFSMALTLTFGLGSAVYHQLRGRLQETTLALRTRELEKERAEKLATEARLQSLESRIHPHFLFNALNSVSALIREQPELAEQQIERISRFLRFALDRSASRLVPLSEELRIVGDYLEIERTRFGERLRFTIDAQPEALAVEVPPLSVQTLVENSVKYAVAPRREGGDVRVGASIASGRLQVEVHDDGPGFDASFRPEGHGLDLLDGRLAAQFGDAASLRFRNGSGMAVIMELPCVRS